MPNTKQQAYISKIEQFPSVLERLVSKLSTKKLTTEYVKGEWTVAQNVHHIVDAHNNKYSLIRQILTEDSPKLREFKEEKWAELPDGKNRNIEYSLLMIRGLHHRVVVLLKSLNQQQWKMAGKHSGFGKISIEQIVESFSTHGGRHITQIKETLQK